MVRIVFVFVANQAAWFASAYGASHFQPAIGVMTCAAALAFALVISDDRIGLIMLALALGLYGFAAEGLLLSSGLVSYNSPGAFPGFPPFWIVALWMAFAIVVNPPLRWLRRHLVLAACLGATLAPLSYLAADRLSALRLSDPVGITLLAIAVVWSVAMPAAIALDDRLSRNEINVETR